MLPIAHSVLTSSSAQNVSHQGGAINNQVSELHHQWCHAMGVPMRRRPWSRQSRARTCISLQACAHIWRFWQKWLFLFWQKWSKGFYLDDSLLLSMSALSPIFIPVSSLVFAALCLKLCSHGLFIGYFFCWITRCKLSTLLSKTCHFWAFYNLLCQMERKSS